MHKNQSGFSYMEVLLLILLSGIIIGTGWYVKQSRQSADNAYRNVTVSSDGTFNGDLAKVKNQPLTAEKLATSQSKSDQESTTKKSSSTSTSKSSTKAKSTSKCANLGSKPTSQVLLDNGYTSTKKFYDALKFAGLLSEVDKADTVVFAVNDYVFDSKLSAEQLAYMNQSPANMKTVLRWHIVHSCITWANTISSASGSVTIPTLAGNVTHYPGSPGNINGVQMAIWDFFSSNGAMHLITGFIKPPVIN